VIVFATGSDSESTPEQRFDRLVDLPPSSKLVYRILDEDGALTQRQIRQRALLPARTTRDALAKLREADLVEERMYVPDARKRLYAPRPVARPDEVDLSA